MHDTGGIKTDAFSSYHPAVDFLFYAGAIVFGMFFVHPVFVLCSCVLAALYYIAVKGRGALKFIAGLLPVLIAISVINPLFNPYGDHALFTWPGGRAYTVEALLYGMAIGAMFVSILLWFASYNAVMTSDKFLYLFGAAAPSVTLVLTMALRMVPNFIRKAYQVAATRKSIGKAGDNGTRRQRAENGMLVVSALTGWALEGGIITADSMRCRGYGCGKRTNFSVYRFGRRDVCLMAVMAVLVLLLLFCSLKGGTRAQFTPELSISGFDNPYTAVGAAAYFVFLAIPTAVDVGEEIKWRILRSGI